MYLAVQDWKVKSELSTAVHLPVLMMFALIANNPLDIQTMVDIAVDFSKRERYLLQPTKSVVLPVKTTTKTKTLEIKEGYWKLDGKDMPVMENTSHIGIQKSRNNSAQLTVDENIKKSSRAMYSLIGTGLHGENGIDPETSISLLRTCILPILYYGLEILLPTGKTLDQINIKYKKILKQILSLYTNVADPAIDIHFVYSQDYYLLKQKSTLRQ